MTKKEILLKVASAHTLKDHLKGFFGKYETEAHFSPVRTQGGAIVNNVIGHTTNYLGPDWKHIGLTGAGVAGAVGVGYGVKKYLDKRKENKLKKIAGLWSGTINAGARLGGGLLKNSPKITSFAGKSPKLFSSIIGGSGGALLGAGVGAMKNPGVDENGQPKSRLKGALIGGSIGALGGGLLGRSKLGRGFGIATASANNPNRINTLLKMKKSFHPIKKVVGTAAAVGGSMAVMGTAGKMLETQSNQTTQGNQKLKNI